MQSQYTQNPDSDIRLVSVQSRMNPVSLDYNTKYLLDLDGLEEEENPDFDQSLKPEREGTDLSFEKGGVFRSERLALET